MALNATVEDRSRRAGQHIWINPTNRVVIVKLSSFPKSAEIESTLSAWAGMNAIARHLGVKDQ